MNLYKLKYPSREEGISDLLSKGVISKTEDGYVAKDCDVVEVGKIIAKMPKMNGPDLAESPTYLPEFHFDIQSEKEFTFTNTIDPKTPKHQFSHG